MDGWVDRQMDTQWRTTPLKGVPGLVGFPFLPLKHPGPDPQNKGTSETSHQLAWRHRRHSRLGNSVHHWWRKSCGPVWRKSTQDHARPSSLHMTLRTGPRTCIFLLLAPNFPSNVRHHGDHKKPSRTETQTMGTKEQAEFPTTLKQMATIPISHRTPAPELPAAAAPGPSAFAQWTYSHVVAALLHNYAQLCSCPRPLFLKKTLLRVKNNKTS